MGKRDEKESEGMGKRKREEKRGGPDLMGQVGNRGGVGRMRGE